MSSMTDSWQPETNGSGHLPRGTTRGYEVKQMAAGTAITLETLRVEIRAEVAKYKNDLQKAETATTTSSSRMKTALNAVKTALGAVGIVTGLMAAITKVVQLGKESLELASDLQEVQNVVDVTFGNMSDQIDEFATNAITQFGLSQTAAKQYASTIGAMLKSMGFQGQELVDMSTNLAGLAADMASFYNLDTDEAFAKIRAGLAGQTEPLAAIGIDLSVANLQEYALSQGITTAYNALTRQEQALLRYNLLLQQTTDSQGDFARTSDGWANQVRVMREQINAIKAEIGSGLMEILLPIVRGINWLLGQVIKGIQALRRFFSRGGGIANVQHNGLDVAVDTTNNLTAAANTASTAVGGIGKAAKAAGKAFTNSSFDELHQLANPSSGSGGSGGGGGGAGVFSGLLGDEDLFDDGARSAGGFSGALNNAEESAGGFWKIMGKVKQSVDDSTSAFVQGQDAITDTWDRAFGMSEKWEAFGTWVDALPASKIAAEETRAMGEVISHQAQAAMWSKLKANYGAAQEGIEAYNSEVRNTYSTLKSRFGPAVTNAARKLTGFVTGSSEAQEGIRRFNEASVNGFHDLAVALGLVTDDADDAREGIDSSTRGIKEDLSKLANDANLKDFRKGLGDLGSKSIESSNDISTATGSIRSNVQRMKTDVVADLNSTRIDGATHLETLRGAANMKFENMRSVASDKMSKLHEAVRDKTADANTDGEKNAESLRATLAKKFSDAAKSASDNSTSIKGSVVDAVSGAKSAVAQQKWADVGGQIKAGIKSGMEFAQGDLKQWADNIKDQVKKEFHINSPSKWARDVIGIGIDEGLLAGMEKGVPILTAATDHIKGTLERDLAMPNLATGVNIAGPNLSPAGSWSPDRSGNWIELMASTIAQRMSANGNTQNEQPIVCEVYLDRDQIATAVSRGQRAQNRRYSSVAMA